MNLQYNAEIRSLTTDAVKATAEQIVRENPNQRIFGYALCTDDDVCGVYHVFCTEAWVSEHSEGYAEIGYISVEWEDSGDDSLFDRVNEVIQADYKNNESDFASNRDKRFESLVLGLKDCRDSNLFDVNTHISVGSTDPCDHLEFMEMRGIDRLNSKVLADSLAKALVFEKYREQASNS